MSLVGELPRRGLAERHATRMFVSQPELLAHVGTVARVARQVASHVEDPYLARLLVDAAWLHDIGKGLFVPPLYGFHPLDGAEWLSTQPEFVTFKPLISAVARHSGALYQARSIDAVRSSTVLQKRLLEFEPHPALERLLWYCDLRSSPRGTVVDIDERLSEIASRHGVDSPVAIAQRNAMPEICSAVAEVEELLATPHAIALAG